MELVREQRKKVRSNTFFLEFSLSYFLCFKTKKVTNTRLKAQNEFSPRLTALLYCHAGSMQVSMWQSMFSMFYCGSSL